ncbi:MAG: hypothetical protein FIB03_17700 [Anaerolineae bacterium]|nr:hypothetical protein [Anaerolineae bacterium]
MNRFWFKSSLILLIVSAVGLAMLLATDQAQAWQEAFVQSDVYATVIYTDPINVRGGPSTVFYPIVGRLSPGDVVPALGVSPGSEWVQIAYPDAPGGGGWVYATEVSISGGELGIVEPPPTQTPIATATVNPTFAAAFIFEPTTTQLPTFTPPPPLEIPQFSDASASRPSGLSSGIVIIGLLLIGAAGLVITSALRKQ